LTKDCQPGERARGLPVKNLIFQEGNSRVAAATLMRSDRSLRKEEKEKEGRQKAGGSGDLPEGGDGAQLVSRNLPQKG